MSVTLSALRTRSRERSDTENSNFISDSELTQYINSAGAELYDLLISSYGDDYFVNEYTFNTVANQDNYSVPSDIYKLLGVDLHLDANNTLTLKKFQWNMRNKYTNFTTSNVTGYPNTQYRLRGSELILNPKPSSVNQISVWYIPKYVELVNDTDTMEDLNNFSEYVVTEAAIRILSKEESDISVLMAQKAALKRRIEEMAQNRDASDSESVQDVYNTSFFDVY